MQNQGFIKLGMVALLSVTMVACQSTEEAATEAAPVANTATPSAANTGDGLTAEQRAARDRALAKTKFYFEFDKSDLSQEDRDALVFHANQLKANPNMNIRLEGHADERGTREYNLALGQKRSEAVRKALNLLGVSDGQIEAVSLGKEKPAMTGSSEEAFAKNRRAEIAYK